MLEKPLQGRKFCWSVVAVWTHWAAPSMELCEPQLSWWNTWEPEGSLLSLWKYLHHFHSNILQNSVLQLVRVGERFSIVTPQSGVRGRVVFLEQRGILRCLHWENGDICWLRASARDSCQPTSVLGKGGKQFLVGFLSLQAMEPLAVRLWTPKSEGNASLPLWLSWCLE